MRFTNAICVALTLGAIGLLLAGGLWMAGVAGKPAPVPPPRAAQPPARAAAPATGNPIAAACGRLHGSPDRTAALQTLRDLQSTLQAMPRNEALAWMQTFLDSGRDQTTGLAFDIAAGGTLSGWPTLRTFLLDTLLAIDPAAAAALSRKLLTTPTTADEWALALRNVGRVETGAQANAYLRERAEALIANPAWQANPSIGYLNAFDVLVHTRATASTPLLSSLIQQKDRRDLAHAGFLTLDRLVQSNPLEVLAQLAADRALLQSRPEMVAQQFARADLRDPAQRQLVKTWLLDPARAATELRSFAATYPNNNRFLSNNLLTATARQSGVELARHDREVLAIITGWAEDPAFQPVAQPLRTMTARLNGFVAAANAAPDCPPRDSSSDPLRVSPP